MTFCGRPLMRPPLLLELGAHRPGSESRVPCFRSDPRGKPKGPFLMSSPGSARPSCSGPRAPSCRTARASRPRGCSPAAARRGLAHGLSRIRSPSGGGHACPPGALSRTSPYPHPRSVTRAVCAGGLSSGSNSFPRYARPQWVQAISYRMAPCQPAGHSLPAAHVRHTPCCTCQPWSTAGPGMGGGKPTYLGLLLIPDNRASRRVVP